MDQWIPWMKSYEIKVSEIDEQHQELFRMFNELMTAVWDGNGKDAVKEMLGFTANYAVNHFVTEENYMLKHGYPGYEAHKKLHDDFTEDVLKFLKEYENGGATAEVVVSVVLNLGNWTREHIRDTDQKLGEYLSVRLQAG
jgi:hemerythrin